MHPSRLPLLLLVVTTLHGGLAHAQHLTYGIEGTVQTFSTGVPAPWDFLTLGEDCRVLLEVDSSVVASPNPINLAENRWFDAVRSVAIRLDGSDAEVSTPTSSTILVRDDDTFVPQCADSLRVFTVTDGGIDLVVVLELQSASCPTVFTSTELPTSLDVSSFGTGPNDRLLALEFPNGAQVTVRIDALQAALSASDNTFEELCHGDGASCTACPCANESAASTGGCTNSFGTAGRLVARGSLSLTAEDGADLAFGASGLVPVFAVLVSGTGVAPLNPSNPCFGSSGGVQSSVADGLRCSVGSVRRHGTRAVQPDGTISPLEREGPYRAWSGPAGVAAGLAASAGFAAGETRVYQAFYRDDPMGACGTGQNTTQALRGTLTP